MTVFDWKYNLRKKRKKIEIYGLKQVTNTIYHPIDGKCEI